MSKFLFICKRRLDTYGISFGLLNSANFVVNYLNTLPGIEAELALVTDANDIDRIVTTLQPNVIVIEALWVTPKKMGELLQRHKNKKWIIRLHSKAPFIANEGIAFPWIAEYKEIRSYYKNFFVSGNHKEFNDDLNSILNIDAIYLPNIYYPSTAKDNDDKLIKHHRTIHIGCFGAIRPMKNHLIQAMAAIRFANEEGLKLNFHINGNRVEQQGENVLKNLNALFEATGHNLVLHPWLPHDEFIQLVKDMDLGMQVSLSESFNIVAADFVSNNIPIIGSPEIEWLSNIFQADPNSTNSIVKTLKRAYNNPYLHYLNRLGLWNHNTKAKTIWENLANLS